MGTFRIDGFGWRHAVAVAVFAAVVAAVPAAILRPGAAARQAEPAAQGAPPEPAAPAQPAEPAAEATAEPVRVARERAVAVGEQASIPLQAFLQPADTGDQRPTFTPGARGHVLPSLCGAAFASVAAITTNGQLYAMYRPTEDPIYIPDDTFYETIAVYRPGGAASFMNELRDAVGACPVNRYEGRQCHESEPGTYALVRAPAHGDETIVVRFTFPEVRGDGPTGKLDSHLYLAVRLGDVVMVLGQQGYEFAHADPAEFHEIGRRAVQRLTDWKRS